MAVYCSVSRAVCHFALTMLILRVFECLELRFRVSEGGLLLKYEAMNTKKSGLKDEFFVT